MCLSHGALFSEIKVPPPEEGEVHDDDIEDENHLVIVVSTDNPKDVQIRRKNAVEIEEIDLTVDDDDCLVYFATSPSHHSIDENIVKTEEISSSSDSDCEMDTTIHASPQFLTSGYSEAAFRISITSELATGIPESVSGIVSLGEINYYFYFKYLC
jgi:hypothetical protein